MSNVDKQALRTVAMLAKELSGISMYSKAIAAINKFHELFTPDVALALLDKLEAKEEQRANWFQMAEKLGADLDAAERRIAELEARQGVMRGLCKHHFYWDVSNVQRCSKCGISISSTDGKGAAK
ncbi:ead/Ea22-like family protein [Citrobacter koseri]|uniref:ead/Ea22-like family protein n=1 Tax=Citrobacter koseri TaxID=545 RepID=UPI0039790DDB